MDKFMTLLMYILPVIWIFSLSIKFNKLKMEVEILKDDLWKLENDR